MILTKEDEKTRLLQEECTTTNLVKIKEEMNVQHSV